MDKVKQNIDLQEGIQRYNIEKSVVGTLAYNIEQNIQKGMSPDEAIQDVLQKSKSMPIGTIHNGFKKIADGKWRKVSESHKMTSDEHRKEARGIIDNGGFAAGASSHIEHAENLDSKDYSDEEVIGGEKKSFSTKEFDTKKEAEKRMSLMNSNSEYSDLKINKTSNNKYIISFKKSQSQDTLSKSEQKDKIKKVMDEFKFGNLKSSSGEKVIDHKIALAIALSEAGLSKED